MASKKVTCMGTTLKGNRCRALPKKGLKYCHRHFPSDKSTSSSFQNSQTNYSDSCPVCLEKEEKMFKLSTCGHKMHLECMDGLISLKCPICKVEMNKLPQKIKKKIENNRKKYKKEIEADNGGHSNDIIHISPMEFIDLIESLITPRCPSESRMDIMEAVFNDIFSDIF